MEQYATTTTNAADVPPEQPKEKVEPKNFTYRAPNTSYAFGKSSFGVDNVNDMSTEKSNQRKD